MTEESRGNIIELLNSLQTKGIILKSYKIPSSEEEFDPFDVELNKNFVKYFYKSSFDMGEELYNEYPMFGNINGCVDKLRPYNDGKIVSENSSNCWKSFLFGII